MASFKEYNNTTFYIGPEGTVSNDGTHTFFLLSDRYSKYPVITPNLGTIWFGLKQDDTFNKILSQNIDTYNGGNGVYFTSSASDCWAKIGPTNETYSPDSDTGMTIKFGITHTQKFREITFKWKDFVVFKFIQYGQPNKLLICKPTWYYYSTASTPIIGFSTSNTKINDDVFHDYAVPNLNKWLCVTEQLNNPNSVHWNLQQIKTISSLKYIEGTDLQNSIYSDYFLINIYKVYDSNNNSIIEEDFDKITNIGLLYIFEMTNEGAKNIGSVTMRKEGTYMLGEIG